MNTTIQLNKTKPVQNNSTHLNVPPADLLLPLHQPDQRLTHLRHLDGRHRVHLGQSSAIKQYLLLILSRIMLIYFIREEGELARDISRVGKIAASVLLKMFIDIW